MSSSFPERSRQSRLQLALLGTVAAIGVVTVAPANAQQTYWQPRVEAGLEQNTNRNLALDKADEADVYGYFATLEVLWGRMTPTSDTRLQPRVRFQRYPDQEDVDRTETFIDFSTRYQPTERSAYDLVARYTREDAFNNELGAAEFDEFDPEAPTEGGDGGALIGEDTRTWFQVRPDFTFEFSEVTGINIGGLAEAVRYDTEFEDRTEYDYYEFRTFMTRRLSPLTRLFGGPVVSRYETRDNITQTDGYGAELGMEHRWSELTRVTGGVFVQRSETDFTDGGTTESESQTDWGFDFNVFRRTELGMFRFSGGRNVIPSSAGNTVVRDELRLQYDHNFSERLSMRAAVRGYTEETQGSEWSGNDRDYVRGELGATWMLTPTFYVRGGYEYTWREIDRDNEAAENHTVFALFGYRGLGRQR